MSRYDYRGIDPLLASRIRLAAVSLLATLEQADFSYLRQQLGASDGNLGTHMQKLVKAGYVTEDKRFVERRPQTRYRLSRKGRRALEAYLLHLQAMLAQASEG